MDKKFISRKQLRKEKRQEKKFKKNEYFAKRGKNYEDDQVNKSNITRTNNYPNKFNKSNLKFNNKQQNTIQTQDNSRYVVTKKKNEVFDESIDSDEEGVNSQDSNDEKLIEDDEEDIQFEDQDELNDNGEDEEEEGDNNGINPEDQNKTELAKLDKQIKKMERKLGLNQEINKQKFKKRLAMENYDDDLIDFLDNITNVVSDPTKKTYSTKDEEEVKKERPLTKKNEKKIEQKKNDVKSESLDEIKKQSKLFKPKDEVELSKIEFIKQITGIFNKTSEGNLGILLNEMISSIVENSKKIKDNNYIFERISILALKLTLEEDQININLTGCICTYVSILHFKYGNNFLIIFMKKIIEKIENARDILENQSSNDYERNHSRNVLKNFIFIIIHLYNNGNINSTFYYDIIELFIEKFNNESMEMLLILLKHVGILIKNENVVAFKKIFELVNQKYTTYKVEEKLKTSGTNNSMEIHTGNKKLEFIVEMINEIKNNKFLSFNTHENFKFFKNFVTTNSKDLENKESKLELGYSQIKRYDLNSDDNDKILFEDQIDENEIIDENLINDNFFNSDKLKKMCRKLKINTDLKKKIFTSIVVSTDYLDSFEKLNRLNLKNEQQREIIKIIVLLIINEKGFNLFYLLLLQKLISFNRDNKYTFHFTLWDQLKIMENFEVKSIHNLAKITASLLISGHIGLPCILNFEFENSNEKQLLFIMVMFDKYFEGSTPEKVKIIFVKLIKNDNHVEFAKKIFAYLLKQFSNDLKIDSKNDEYKNNYNTALKILKKIV